MLGCEVFDERINENAYLGGKTAMARIERVNFIDIAYGFRKDAHKGALRNGVFGDEIRQPSNAGTPDEHRLQCCGVRNDIGGSERDLLYGAVG